MLKRSIYISLIILLILVFTGCGRSASEVSDSKDNTNNDPHMGNVHNLDLSISDSDQPHVSYDPVLNSYRVAVKKYNGASMETLNTNPVSLKTGAYSAIAHHSDGTVYVAFSDENQDYKITVMKNSGTGWSVVGAAGFSTSVASYISIDLDSAGIPYVAYANLIDGDDQGGLVSVKRFVGGNWQSVGQTYLTTNKGYFVSLKINPADNQPYLVYVDKLLANRAVCRYFDGSSWQILGTQGFTGPYTFYTNIEISSTGNIFVSYEDPEQLYKVTVKNYSGGDWQTVGSPGFSSGEAYYSSLSVSPTGVPVVAFIDSSNSSKVTVMNYIGSAWQTVGLAGFSLENASWTSIDHDSSSTIYVAFKVGETSIPYLYKYSAGSWQLLASNF